MTSRTGDFPIQVNVLESLVQTGFDLVTLDTFEECHGRLLRVGIVLNKSHPSPLSSVAASMNGDGRIPSRLALELEVNKGQFGVTLHEVVTLEFVDGSAEGDHCLRNCMLFIVCHADLETQICMFATDR